MKRWIIVVVVIAVLAGGGWFFLQSRLSKAQEGLTEGYSTEPVILGDIEAIVSATGSVSLPQSEAVAFASTGEIVEILVQEGDSVTKGQVLARFDDTDARLQVNQAKAALLIAEAQLVQARTGSTQAELDAAQASIDLAQSSVDMAQAGFDALHEGVTQRTKELALLAIDQAKNSRWAAQASRDAIKGNKFADDASVDQAEANILNAEVAVQISETQYEQLFEGPRASAVAQAKAQIAQAEAQVAQAEANMRSLKGRPTAESIAVAEASVAQAQVSVEIAERRLDSLTLEAPIDGHLVTWDAYVGETVGPQNILGTVIDDSYFEIVVTIDETDIGQIAVDQRVYMTLDAYPDDEVLGHISDIDTLGNNVQGIVTYEVTVQIESTDLNIKPLMTAAVDIVTDRRENVLLAPNRALRRDADGKYVEILKAQPSQSPTRSPFGTGGPQIVSPVERIDIETGVSNDEYTQVLSGLDEGQEVVISKPRGSLFENAGGGGPFGG